MVEGEAMNQYAQQWYARESPGFSYLCLCGLAISGQSEKGLHTLMKRHKEKGIFHLEWEGKTDAVSDTTIKEVEEVQVQEEVLSL